MHHPRTFWVSLAYQKELSTPLTVFAVMWLHQKKKGCLMLLWSVWLTAGVHQADGPKDAHAAIYPTVFLFFYFASPSWLVVPFDCVCFRNGEPGSGAIHQCFSANQYFHKEGINSLKSSCRILSDLIMLVILFNHDSHVCNISINTFIILLWLLCIIPRD